MISSRPDVDVLLAVYNGEAYLSSFLDSLVAQTFRNFRLIVSDNKSNDDTRSILESYRPKFEGGLIVMQPPPETVCAPLNFSRVTGASDAHYAMYADADDVWHADKIVKSLAVMRDAERRFGASTPILVHSDLVVVDRDLKPLHHSLWDYQLIDPTRTGLNKLLMQNCVTGCTMMLNRPLIRLGHPLPVQAPSHDYWFALVASAFGQIVAIREPLIEYRQHGGNLTGARHWCMRYIIKRAGELFSDNGPRAGLYGSIEQAKIFLVRYRNELPLVERETLEAFVEMQTQGVVERRYSLMAHGFWKYGLARNVGVLLSV